MIKLIASDMDGSLLNDRKELPPDFFEVLDRLGSRGIKFAVASGRSYDAVAHLFPEEYRRRLDFICDNGANIYHEGKQARYTPLERSTFEQLIGACREIGGLRVLVCAQTGTYHLAADSDFTAEIAKYYKNHIPCDDLLSVNEVIYKVAVCDTLGTENHAKPALDAIMGDRLNVQVSGPIWMDVMSAGVNKGSALEQLAELLCIDSGDVMAFGDYFNDEEMLRFAGWSFAMENGHRDIKKLARFIAHSNNENGVMRAVRKYALGEDTD